jgi:hypothetical protein
MTITKAMLDRFLRTAITISVFAFIVMLLFMFLDPDPWYLWLPGVTACAGVIVSFGVYVNKIHNRPGHPEVTTSSETKPAPQL